MNEYLCKDCKHAFVTWVDRLFYLFDTTNKYKYTCRKSWQPTKQEINPVTGLETMKAKYQGCASFRIGHGEEGNCGYEAYYWQPKDKKDLFKLIDKKDS